MTYRSETQPLCRFCGKAIPKIRTTFTASDASTKEEIKRLWPNAISIERNWNRGGYEVQTWDGESYYDEFFCNAHLKAFALWAVSTGLAHPDYVEARSKQEAP